MSDPMAIGSDRTRRWRMSGMLMVAVGVVTLAVLALAIAWRPISPDIPRGSALSWKLGLGYQVPRFDPAAAQITTTVSIEVDQLTCPGGRDVRGLLPIVTYTPLSVTITIPGNGDTSGCYHYLSGTGVTVQLREPLGGRTLFDGSLDPPAARPY